MRLIVVIVDVVVVTVDVVVIDVTVGNGRRGGSGTGRGVAGRRRVIRIGRDDGIRRMTRRRMRHRMLAAAAAVRRQCRLKPQVGQIEIDAT